MPTTHCIIFMIVNSYAYFYKNLLESFGNTSKTFKYDVDSGESEQSLTYMGSQSVYDIYKPFYIQITSKSIFGNTYIKNQLHEHNVSSGYSETDDAFWWFMLEREQWIQNIKSIVKEKGLFKKTDK